MELLGTTPNELLFVLFLLGIVLLGTKVGDIGAALGRWTSGRAPSDRPGSGSDSGSNSGGNSGGRGR